MSREPEFSSPAFSEPPEPAPMSRAPSRMPVKLHKNVTLIRTSEPVLAEELLARKSLARLVLARLSETLLAGQARRGRGRDRGAAPDGSHAADCPLRKGSDGRFAHLQF